jgi:hypothetical protein
MLSTCSKELKLFVFPVFFFILWSYLTRVIAETRRAHLRFYHYINVHQIFFRRKKIVNYNSAFWYRKKIRCRRMVDLFTTTYVISAYHHWYSEFESRSGRDVQHYVIKFVSDFRQVGGFLRVLWSPAPIKLTTAI